MDEGIYWDPIADFVKFVVEANDTDFKNDIGQQLALDNAINYFILLNLIRADDNVGKNTFLAKYQQSDPFFFVPWDMDATWGLNWRGNPTPSTGILSNGLFDRLLATDADNFRNRLQSRWQSARMDVLNKDQLMVYFQNYASQLDRRNAFARERHKWNVESELATEINRIDQWLENRLAFLDSYFEAL